MRQSCSALGVACIITLLAGQVYAQADNRQAAREHFARGTKYFDLGRFDEAVKEYEAAYELKDEPVLLYNIAQAHRLASHAREALHFYKAFLRRVPKAQNRDEVEMKIAELEKLLEQQQRTVTLPPDNPLMPGERATTSKPPPASKPGETRPAETKPVAVATKPVETKPVVKAVESKAAETKPVVVATRPVETKPVESKPVEPIEIKPAETVAEQSTETPAPKPEEPKPVVNNPGRTKKIAGLALVGVGAAALIGGIACSALAAGAGDDVSNMAKNGQAFDPSTESAGKTYELVAAAMYGVGGALVVAGAVVTYLGFRDAKLASRAMLVPAVSPSHAGAMLRVSF